MSAKRIKALEDLISRLERQLAIGGLPSVPYINQDATGAPDLADFERRYGCTPDEAIARGVEALVVMVRFDRDSAFPVATSAAPYATPGTQHRAPATLATSAPGDATSAPGEAQTAAGLTGDAAPNSDRDGDDWKRPLVPTPGKDLKI